LPRQPVARSLRISRNADPDRAQGATRSPQAGRVGARDQRNPQRTVPRTPNVTTVMSPPKLATRASRPYDRSRLTSQSSPPPSTSTKSALPSIGPPPATTPPSPANAYGTYLSTSKRYTIPASPSAANEVLLCIA